MSLFCELGDMVAREQYIVAFGSIIRSAESAFQCVLFPYELEDVEYVVGNLLSEQTRSDLVEYEMLSGLFEAYNIKLQQMLCEHFYSAYPVVCDIATNIVIRLLRSKLPGVYDLYLVTGGHISCGKGTYHLWVLAISKDTGSGYFIDPTYIQFLEEGKTYESFVTGTGDVRTITTFDMLRERVLYCPGGMHFPSVVIQQGSKDWDSWLPSYAVRVKE